MFEPVPNSWEIPDAVLNAKKEEKLAIFVGAGYPEPFGTWGWDKLAIGFVDKCVEEGIWIPRERTRYVKLIAELGARSVITVCFEELVNRKKKDDIKAVLEASCKVSQTEINGLKDVYFKLRQLGDYFITTNYDPHFDSLFRIENIVYKKEDFFISPSEDFELSKESIYHVHGSLLDFESIVLTRMQYNDRYSNPNFRAFLEVLFKKYNVLFIGYGLGDTDLSNILVNLKSKGLCNTHFLLKHYYVDERDNHNFDLKYYNDFNVRVLPYLGDFKEFKALYDIVDSWNNSISKTELDLVE